MNAKVIGIAIGPETDTGERILRQAVEQAELKPDHGIVGDRKAGSENRQVNLLTRQTYDWYARNFKGEREMPGGFGENIVIDGDIDLNWLDNDVALRIGEASMKVLWPRTPCEIMRDKAGIDRVERMNGRVGVFCAVLQGGMIKVGDTVTVE